MQTYVQRDVRLTACSAVRVCARDVARCAARVEVSVAVRDERGAVRVVRCARDTACNAVRDALCSAARGELGAMRNARVARGVGGVGGVGGARGARGVGDVRGARDEACAAARGGDARDSTIGDSAIGFTSFFFANIEGFAANSLQLIFSLSFNNLIIYGNKLFSYLILAIINLIALGFFDNLNQFILSN